MVSVCLEGRAHCSLILSNIRGLAVSGTPDNAGDGHHKQLRDFIHTMTGPRDSLTRPLHPSPGSKHGWVWFSVLRIKNIIVGGRDLSAGKKCFTRQHDDITHSWNPQRGRREPTGTWTLSSDHTHHRTHMVCTCMCSHTRTK